MNSFLWPNQSSPGVILYADSWANVWFHLGYYGNFIRWIFVNADVYNCCMLCTEVKWMWYKDVWSSCSFDDWMQFSSWNVKTFLISLETNFKCVCTIVVCYARGETNVIQGCLIFMFFWWLNTVQQLKCEDISYFTWDQFQFAGMCNMKNYQPKLICTSKLLICYGEIWECGYIDEWKGEISNSVA